MVVVCLNALRLHHGMVVMEMIDYILTVHVREDFTHRDQIAPSLIPLIARMVLIRQKSILLCLLGGIALQKKYTFDENKIDIDTVGI